MKKLIIIPILLILTSFLIPKEIKELFWVNLIASCLFLFTTLYIVFKYLKTVDELNIEFDSETRLKLFKKRLSEYVVYINIDKSKQIFSIKVDEVKGMNIYNCINKSINFSKMKFSTETEYFDNFIKETVYLIEDFYGKETVVFNLR